MLLKNYYQKRKTPIAQVASEVGYDNYSYFTKIFKEKIGVSPGGLQKTAYRLNNKKELVQMN